MAVSTRIIRRRIKSIGNTKKITKAMELVSASKMRRAVNAVLGTRPYATLGWETVAELAKVTETGLHPLLRQPEAVRRVLTIFVTSDRGLCGGFNAQMAKKVVEFVKKAELWSGKSSALNQSEAKLLPQAQHKSLALIDFVTIGKKGTDLARRLGWNIVATFVNLSNNPTIIEVRPIATLAITDFTAQKYDAVYLAYTDFVSSIRQISNIKQLLPLTKDTMLGEVRQLDRHPERSEGSPTNVGAAHSREILRSAQNDKTKFSYDYIFEPTPQEVLDMMLPRLVETQIYQAILESSASEHSARMVAMKNASDAARDMIDDLTFTFNQARQAY